MQRRRTVVPGRQAALAERRVSSFGVLSFVLPVLVVVRGQLRAVRLASAGPDHGAGLGGLPPARHAHGQGRVRRGSGRTRRSSRRPQPEGVPANPIYLPAPHEVVARVLHRVHDAAPEPRRPVAAPEPVAQHPDHLLGLPHLVADRRAAGHPVRRLSARSRG